MRKTPLIFLLTVAACGDSGAVGLFGGASSPGVDGGSVTERDSPGAIGTSRHAPSGGAQNHVDEPDAASSRDAESSPAPVPDAGAGPLEDGGQGSSGGSGGFAGTGGVSGSGGIGGSGGDPNCISTQKLCGGECVYPSPSVGCGPGNCVACAPPPPNGYLECRDSRCVLKCKAGYVADAIERSCDPVGSGGSGGTGGSSGGSGGVSGSGGTGGAPIACSAGCTGEDEGSCAMGECTRGDGRGYCAESNVCTSCPAATLDCDGDPSNGCETAVTRDNCGSCGAECGDYATSCSWTLPFDGVYYCD